jgi:hypothetical protein
MMLERGVNSRVVQEYLGHKNISTTLGIYTGITSQVMQEAVSGVDEAIRGMCGKEENSTFKITRENYMFAVNIILLILLIDN